MLYQIFIIYNYTLLYYISFIVYKYFLNHGMITFKFIKCVYKVKFIKAFNNKIMKLLK